MMEKPVSHAQAFTRSIPIVAGWIELVAFNVAVLVKARETEGGEVLAAAAVADLDRLCEERPTQPKMRAELAAMMKDTMRKVQGDLRKD